MAGRAETRARLIAAAGEAFAERGLQEVSIDEVARRAGFTKGAFYANFASKEELFLAMLDERFERRAREMHVALGTDEDPEVQARRSGDEFADYLAADPEWQRLFFEFAVLAARDPGFRAELVARYRGLRDTMATDYERRAADLNFELPFPVADLALMTFAMGNGVALEQLLEPEAVPEGFFGTMLAIWVAGLRALAGPGPAVDHAQVAAPPGCEAEARRFYGGLLGLREIEKPAALAGRGGVWFDGLHIGVERDFSPARKAHPGLRIAPDRLDGLAQRLSDAGAPVEWDEAIPGVRRFYTADPWGNRLELLA